MRTGAAQEIWDAALGELQIQVSKPNYRTWLEKTIGLSYQENQFVISVPNTFVAEYLDQKLRSLIEKTLMNLTHHDTTVFFQVDSGHQNPADNYRTRDKASSTTLTSQSGLNPKYTFDSFIVGSCNRLVHAAALGIVENPGGSYNPLFIYGEAGLGKTHLLQAIAHSALASNIQIIYTSAEQFTNEFVNAIREKKTKEFRNKYTSVQMLLMDDIHFISRKEQTAESFFHTFNELHNANRQIVITSNCPPSSLPLLHEGLRSRLEWGLVTDIQPPDFGTRLAILQAKANQQEADVAQDILEFIAHRSQRSIRTLEGSLNRIIAYAKLVRVPLTPELAAKALEDIASKKAGGHITPGLVIQAVANSFQLTPSEIRSRQRNKEIALAREVAMYIMRQETNCSLAQIGKELGDRQPIAVSHGCKKIANEIDVDPQMRAKVLDIQQSLNSK